MAYMATTGRSMISSTKPFPPPSEMTFIFLLSTMSVFSGIQFRMNQAFIVLSDLVIHCIHLGFAAILPKDALIHFESDH